MYFGISVFSFEYDGRHRTIQISVIFRYVPMVNQYANAVRSLGMYRKCMIYDDKMDVLQL